MTANCQNVTSYGRKHQHLWDDFVNRNHKLHQQHMSALNKNKYTDSITWRFINSRTLQICKGMEFIFREAHIKLWYTRRQSQKRIMTSGKTRISTRNQTNSFSLRDQ